MNIVQGIHVSQMRMNIHVACQPFFPVDRTNEALVDILSKYMSTENTITGRGR